MKTPKEVTAQRERDVWDLRQQMWTQQKIADQLNINQSAVSQILKRLVKRYEEQNLEDISRVKNEQVSQLETASALAWKNYVENNDARHLTGYLKAKEDIRKILGADAPQKMQLSGDEKADAIKVDITTTRDRFLDKLTRLAEQGKSDPATS